MNEITPARPAVGSRILHPEYGPATLQFLGEEYAGLVFDDGQEVLARYAIDTLVPWSDAGEAAWRAARQAEARARQAEKPLDWPASTFSHETGDDPHFMGSHWDAFDEQGSDAMLRELPRYLQEAQLPNAPPLPSRPLHALPATWAKGVHLFWPDDTRGLAITVLQDDAAKRLVMVSIYPHCGAASEFELEIDRVHVWESGVEAQIEASLGEATLCFFDTHFLLARSEYKHGRRLRFSLAGLAYRVAPCTVFELPFSPNPEQIAWQAQRAEAQGDTYEVPTVIHLEGMAMLIPVPEWDRDDYSFRGPVKSVEPFIGFLGQAGWKVSVTVLRGLGSEADDIDLDIFITRLAWQGDAPPQPGQDIEGTLWLQGRLATPNVAKETI